MRFLSVALEHASRVRPLPVVLVSALASLSGAVSLPAQTASHAIHPSQITWRGGAGGISTAVLDGDPGTEGSHYTMAIRLADGAWIRPHFHTRDKTIVVLSGVLRMGHGEALVAEGAEEHPAGAFLRVPAGTRHFEGGRGETVILLSGIGPLRTTFVTADSARARSP